MEKEIKEIRISSSVIKSGHTYAILPLSARSIVSALADENKKVIFDIPGFEYLKDEDPVTMDVSRYYFQQLSETTQTASQVYAETREVQEIQSSEQTNALQENQQSPFTPLLEDSAMKMFAMAYVRSRDKAEREQVYQEFEETFGAQITDWKEKSKKYIVEYITADILKEFDEM